MDKHRLEELQSTSLPALRHVELVELAKVHSPSQVYKLARSAQWPNRQAKAARSLATLRRDNPEGFNAFLATMERARPDEPVTEQAQENRRSEMQAQEATDRLVKSLDRVTDLAARLRLAVKHDLKDQVAAIVTSLFDTWEVMYWTHEEDKNILFDTLKDVHTGIVVSTDKDSIERDRKHRERNLVAFIRPGETRASLLADVGGMQEYLEWQDVQMQRLVRSSFDRLVAKDPSPQGWRMHKATLEVCQRFIPATDDLARQTELWILRSRLGGGRLFELRRIALPTPLETADDDRNELDPIVDRLVELGMTMDAVKTEFMGHIRRVVENCRPQFMIALCGAKCFSYSDHSKGELCELLCEKYRPKMWHDLVHSNGDFMPRVYEQMLHCGMRGEYRSEQEVAFYRKGFVDLLAEGKLTHAWQIMLCIGAHVLFYAELEESIFKGAREYIAGIAPEAFTQAYSKGNYGVAAALVQQFGKEAFLAVNPQIAKDMFESDYAVVAKEHAAIAEKYDNGDDTEEDAPAIEAWRAAETAVDEKVAAKHEELVQKRKDEINEVGQLAADLMQPICFTDTLSYYLAPKWPKH